MYKHYVNKLYFVICRECGDVRSFPSISAITRTTRTCKTVESICDGLCIKCHNKYRKEHSSINCYFILCERCGKVINQQLSGIMNRKDFICQSCLGVTRTDIDKIIRQRKNNGCVICGYDKCKSALDFHHVEPKIKSFSLIRKRRLSLNEWLTELDKCALLCSNCHREMHAKLYMH